MFQMNVSILKLSLLLYTLLSIKIICVPTIERSSILKLYKKHHRQQLHRINMIVTVFTIAITQLYKNSNNVVNDDNDVFSNRDGSDGYVTHRNSDDFELISRDEWEAKPPKLVENMTNPVPFVVIHHSYMPPACNTTKECIEAMQWMQDFHQNDRGWNDIGYNFAVGGDGKAYVGRGWSTVGAHAPGYNSNSIGICIIGDWQDQLPPHEQLETTKKLIQRGINLGMIVEDYTLCGHRQVRDTECPGNTLYAEINMWPHFKDITDDKASNIVPT